MLEKAVETKETRFISRVLRSLATTRRRLTVDVLKQLINLNFVHESDQATKQKLLYYISSLPLDVDKPKINPNNNNNNNNNATTPSEAPMEVTNKEAAVAQPKPEAAAKPEVAAVKPEVVAAKPEAQQPLKNTPVLPEIEVYIYLLVTIYLIDKRRYQEVSEL